tara:strand:- start:300 stop:635 length:336 start_codon:yes stop_codon:yes gene_type:complete
MKNGAPCWIILFTTSTKQRAQPFLFGWMLTFINPTTGNMIMTTLREKMKEEMLLMGLAASTQAVYMKALVNLYHHYKQSPAELSAEQLRAYLLSLKKSLWPLTRTMSLFMP